jgi:hypothetical protein
MSTAPISASPASIIPDLIAAEMVGGGGSTGEASAPGSDAAAFSAQAIAMLAAEQSAMQSVLGAMPS